MIIIMIIMKVGPRTGFRTVCNISNSGFPCQTVTLCTLSLIFYRQNQAKPRNSNTAIVANRRAYWNQKLELFLSFWTTRTDIDLLFVSLRVSHLWILVSRGILHMRPQINISPLSVSTWTFDSLKSKFFPVKSYLSTNWTHDIQMNPWQMKVECVQIDSGKCSWGIWIKYLD